MTDTLTGAPASNWIAGAWRESASGETYRSGTPGGPRS